MKFFVGIWSVTIIVLSGVLYAAPAVQQTGVQQVIGRSMARMIYTSKDSPYGALRDFLSKQVSAGGHRLTGQGIETSPHNVIAENISELFDLNADLENEGIPPLSLAIQLKKPHAMKHLLAAGADIDALGGKGTSPFGEILSSDQLDVALLVAIELENTELATRLIDVGADANNISRYASQMEMFTSASRKDLHIAPILVAAKTGNVSMMKLLYNRGADINSQDNNGNGVLHYLASKGDAEAYTWALSKGLDPNDNASLLEIVAQKKNETGMITLLEGGNFSADTLGRALVAVVRRSSDTRRMLYTIFEAGGDANYRIEGGYTLLMVHVKERRLGEYISNLLSAGADPALQDDEGNTVLHVAVQWRRGKDVFEPLLRKNVADLINIKNNAGFTALDIARSKGSVDGSTGTSSAEELLLNAGAKTAAELDAVEAE